jgi:hypothetical protein
VVIFVKDPNDISRADVVSDFDSGAVFQGYGNSHFTYDRDSGYHETTEIPDMGQGTEISVSTDIPQG